MFVEEIVLVVHGELDLFHLGKSTQVPGAIQAIQNHL